MTREEFEKALDRYIVPAQSWGHADKESTCWGKNEGQECCLEQEEVRQFLWELHTEGLDAINKLPPLPKEEPHEWEQKTPASELDMSRYAIMNREVQELKAGKGAVRDE